jgi:hypothetical protein
LERKNKRTRRNIIIGKNIRIETNKRRGRRRITTEINIRRYKTRGKLKICRQNGIR